MTGEVAGGGGGAAPVILTAISSLPGSASIWQRAVLVLGDVRVVLGDASLTIIAHPPLRLERASVCNETRCLAGDNNRPHAGENRNANVAISVLMMRRGTTSPRSAGCLVFVLAFCCVEKYLL